jgi:hypothetical protein
MKSAKFAFAAFSILMLSLFASCTSNDDNSSGGNNNNVNPNPGKWKLTYFFDKKDETGNYTGYTFDFGSDGSLSATNGGQSWSGTWQTGIDDRANKFLIDFTGTLPSALAELEEDWRIIAIEDDFMHFEHTSGGNGDTDVLKFAKL